MAKQPTCGEAIHYLPRISGSAVRVRLTAEAIVSRPVGSFRDFLGEYEGTPVSVMVCGVDVIRIRRAIEAHGSVLWDASPSWISELDQDGLTTAQANERGVRVMRQRMAAISAR